MIPDRESASLPARARISWTWQFPRVDVVAGPVISSPLPADQRPALPPAQPGAMRRLLLQIDLRSTPLPVAMLPLRFGWESWLPDREAAHAAVLFEGFRDGIDAGFMRALSTLNGCHDLMTATSHHQYFLPEATWLAVRQAARGACVPVGTIQVIGSPSRVARIQNLTVIPEVRGRGIARAALIRCLRSCRSLGYDVVELEVTALNTPAVELYRSVGFLLRRSYVQESGP